MIKTVGIIDSGIGGVFVLKKLAQNIKGEKFVYYGDNQNVPYGNKSPRELLSLAIGAATQLLPYNPKCLVLGCNTLSLTVRSDLEKFSGIPVFGVFPPVESEVFAGKKTLLIATERTCSFFNGKRGITVLPQKHLAKSVEDSKFTQNIDFIIEGKNFFYRFDSVILGCTHYEFIKNAPVFKFLTTEIKSGIDDCVKQVEKWNKTCKKIKKHQ